MEEGDERSERESENVRDHVRDSALDLCMCVRAGAGTALAHLVRLKAIVPGTSHGIGLSGAAVEECGGREETPREGESGVGRCGAGGGGVGAGGGGDTREDVCARVARSDTVNPTPVLLEKEEGAWKASAQAHHRQWCPLPFLLEQARRRCLPLVYSRPYRSAVWLVAQPHSRPSDRQGSDQY